MRTMTKRSLAWTAVLLLLSGCASTGTGQNFTGAYGGLSGGAASEAGR